MITQYTIIGTENVRYKAVVHANSVDEAEIKFLNIIRSKEHDKYDMMVSGIRLQIDAAREEE